MSWLTCFQQGDIQQLYDHDLVYWTSCVFKVAFCTFGCGVLVQVSIFGFSALDPSVLYLSLL